jgi:hypothetical protein
MIYLQHGTKFPTDTTTRGLDSIPTQTRRRGWRQPSAHQTSALMRSKILRLNTSLAPWDGVSSPSPPATPRWVLSPPQTPPGTAPAAMYGLGFRLLHVSRRSCCQRCSAPHPRRSTARGSRCRYGGWRNRCQGTLARRRLCLYPDPAHPRLLLPPVPGQAATGGGEKWGHRRRREVRAPTAKRNRFRLMWLVDILIWRQR